MRREKAKNERRGAGKIEERESRKGSMVRERDKKIPAA